MLFTVDLEVTNRCNARCDFCPRELTPHQGLMSVETFDQALSRVIELRDDVRAVNADIDVTVTMCGLGEPLLNRHVPAYVRRVRAAGFKCELSTNASLLDEARARALLDAGLNGAYINAGEINADYDDVYGLPFERTRDNIERFAVMAAGRCHVRIIVVDQHNAPARARKIEDYWRAHGVEHVSRYHLINRGGSLAVDSMRFERHPLVAMATELLAAQPVSPICGVPFRFLFVGYDGNYYLCSSDREKRTPLGTVFDSSFTAVVRRKLEHVQTRDPICRTCCHDPTNRLAQRLAQVDAVASATTVADLVEAEVQGEAEARRFAGVLSAADVARTAPSRAT